MYFLDCVSSPHLTVPVYICTIATHYRMLIMSNLPFTLLAYSLRHTTPHHTNHTYRVLRRPLYPAPLHWWAFHLQKSVEEILEALKIFLGHLKSKGDLFFNLDLPNLNQRLSIDFFKLPLLVGKKTSLSFIIYPVSVFLKVINAKM